MEPEQIKRYTAIIELWILFALALYLIQRVATEFALPERPTLSETDPSASPSPIQRVETPAVAIPPTITADPAKPTEAAKDTKSFFQSFIGEKTRALFARFLDLFSPIFNAFSKIFEVFTATINRIRNVLMPIRLFFMNATKMFLEQFQHFTIGILYSFHKMRNAMKRTVAGFNLIFHSIEHTKNTLDSIVQSPLLDTVARVLNPARWVENQNAQFCFHKYTWVNVCNDPDHPVSKYIHELRIGDILENGSRVISTQSYLNNIPLYQYRQRVFVSGNHFVWEPETSQWVLVRDSAYAIPTRIQPRRVYSISTTHSTIPIEGIVFKDYSESHHPAINQMIQSCVLDELNLKIPSSSTEGTRSAPTYLLQGFGINTPVRILMNGEIRTVPIQHLRMGDRIGESPHTTQEVIGIIHMDGSCMNLYHWRGMVVSGTLKVWSDKHGRWVCVEDLTEEIRPADAKESPMIYHVVVTGTHECVIGGVRVRDFVEIGSDSQASHEVEELIRRYT